MASKDDTTGGEAIVQRPQSDEAGRDYKAARGKRMAHVEMLLFIPNDRDDDRYLPYADLRLLDASKDACRIIMEFSNSTIVILGRNLRLVANGIAGRQFAELEAFNPIRRDRPTDPLEPFIDSIRFYHREPKEAPAKPRAEAPPNAPGTAH